MVPFVLLSAVWSLLLKEGSKWKNSSPFVFLITVWSLLLKEGSKWKNSSPSFYIFSSEVESQENDSPKSSKCKVSVAQSRLSLCDPRDCSPPGSFVHGFSRQEHWSGLPFPWLQGIFLTQGSNPGLHHCRWILYHLSHQGSLVNVKISHYFHICRGARFKTPKHNISLWNKIVYFSLVLKECLYIFSFLFKAIPSFQLTQLMLEI